jgi:hypothetical protein
MSIRAKNPPHVVRFESWLKRRLSQLRAQGAFFLRRRLVIYSTQRVPTSQSNSSFAALHDSEYKDCLRAARACSSHEKTAALPPPVSTHHPLLVSAQSDSWYDAVANKIQIIIVPVAGLKTQLKFAVSARGCFL